ncbi:unnamed protein product [Clonostachys rosea f. rosea IK726]|uniref:Cupin type-1 domain-containing protein n=2 Tax=Bionectria ochroleuca TaxID=29856 RepID=A0A0B7K0G2_BIOOC|nr:unnamed protein product [Clonostachys rosea f. rosea IK726]
MEFPNVDLNLRWQDQKVVKKDGLWVVEGRPIFNVQLSHLHHPSNLPGKTWTGVLVSGPPNAATPPHTHAGAAVVATVIRGHVLNQMVHTHFDPVTGQKKEHSSGAKIYGPGESWYEAPGCHHVRSENAGSEDCEFVANLILDSSVFEGLDLEDRSQLGDIQKIQRFVVIDADVEEKRLQGSE